MPMRRTRKSSNLRKKRAYRKKAPMLIKRAVRSNLVSITRQYVGTEFTATYAQGWQYSNLTFTLGALQNYTEFTNLFGKYRINAVKVTFLPSYSGNDIAQVQANASAAGTWGLLPRVHYLTDTSGLVSSQIDSESEFLEYSSARTVRDPTKPFSIYIRKPAVHLGTANITSIVGGAPKNVWIDTANYNIVHHGAAVGMIVPGGSSAGSWKFQVIVKFYMQFKEAQ